MKAFAIDTAKEILSNSPAVKTGKVFGATFTKRTNGELRKGSFRCRVIKHLKGGELTFDPEEKDLFMCFDMNQSPEGYRSIPLEGVHEIRVDGKVYTPENPDGE
jgi:hypothetical protein